MSTPPDLSPTPAAGLGNVYRFIGVGAVLALALLGSLVVLEIIPADAFGRASSKVLGVAVVIALASTAVAFLMRAGKR